MRTYRRLIGIGLGGILLVVVLLSCAECHAADLRGREGGPPDLQVGAAYSLEAFTRLIREGVPLDGRELGLMRDVAVGRFSHFTHEEIAALRSYLLGRAREPLPEAG